jgi:two-component system NarL family response regulator
MTKPIRVMTVDDHPLIREGLAALLADHPDISIVGEASDGDEATVKFDELLPDIVLLDLQMPRMSGLEALEIIKGKHPWSRFIILTTYNTEQLASKALNAGAQAYLLKSSVRHELVDTIHAVFRGQRRIASDIAESLAAHADDDAHCRWELKQSGW